MLKGLFGLLFSIIYQPSKAWNMLSEKQETDNENFFKSYFYPLLGIIALFSFLGVFFTRKEFEVQLALKNAISLLIAVYAGLYLASYLLSEFRFRYLGKEKDLKLCQRFVGYASAIVYALYLVLSFFPEFFFLKIFLLYTVYIVWEGATSYMGVEEKHKLKFTLLASVIIILCPFLIEKITFMLMPGLRA